MELYNQKLEVSESDIKNETSIEKLNEWKFRLESQLKNINHNLRRREHVIDNVRIKDARFYAVTFLEFVTMRLKELKESTKKDTLLMRKFMKVAKIKLSKDLYKEILKEAKVLAKYEDKSDGVTDID